MQSPLDATRWSNFGRLLLLGDQVFTNRAEAKVRAAGFPEFGGALRTLVRAMQVEGSRIGGLAARAGVTQQAMSLIVAEFSAKGYVRIAVDPHDRRARLVVYTALGRDLAQAAVRAVQDVEAEFASVAGAARFTKLKRELAALVDALPEAQAAARLFLNPAGPEPATMPQAPRRRPLSAR